jgi:hypothetical protein
VRASVTVAAVILALVVGCARDSEPVTRPPEAFCDAAAELDEELPRADIREQIRLVRRMLAAAPAEIEPETRTFLEALERVEADPDNPELRDDPDVRAAVEDVNRFAIEGCELLEQGGNSPL